uniref:Uncharacterized protein n=1 Tax=Sphaerodactylus townsendi TaxID=933632 RepID=A0ACB8FWS0_9SAUR
MSEGMQLPGGGGKVSAIFKQGLGFSLLAECIVGIIAALDSMESLWSPLFTTAALSKLLCVCVCVCVACAHYEHPCQREKGSRVLGRIALRVLRCQEHFPK